MPVDTTARGEDLTETPCRRPVQCEHPLHDDGQNARGRVDQCDILERREVGLEERPALAGS